MEEFTKSDDAENFIGSIKFKEATTQAGPRIAYRAAKGLTDAIMSADSDFAAYLETDGLCLKDWHYNARGLHSCRGCFCQQVNGLLPLKLMLCWSAISDEFARNDLVNNLHVKLINLFDRGYRCIVTAFSAGGQTRLQSSFAQSDQRYSSNEILDSGAVAATRSGNERPVRPARQSWVIKRGAAFQPFDFDWLAEQWLAWGCQVHLMYDPVH